MTGAHRMPPKEKQPMTTIPWAKLTGLKVLTYIFAVVVACIITMIIVVHFVGPTSNNSSASYKLAPVHSAQNAIQSPHSIVPVPSPSASAPSRPTTTDTSTPATSSPVSTTAPPTTIYEHVYIVRAGDTLTSIANTFKLNGYAPLYTWNQAVIGANPDLIYPGQQLIVNPGSPPPVIVNP